MSCQSVLCAWTRATGLASLMLALGAAVVFAQPREEDAPTVSDAVIAQVDGDVVMLSTFKRELQQASETLTRGGMPQQQAAEQAAKNQARIIVKLIDERLVLQKGKELPNLPEDVEAEVNRRMAQIAQQQGIKTIEELGEVLRRQGLDMAEMRQAMRTQHVKQEVFSREVDAKIYRGLSDAELRAYFDANQERTGSREPVFDEHQVRAAITQERAPRMREQYLRSLWKEAYIKIAAPYEAAVGALLKAEMK
jgi:hypothetical protein